MNKLCVEPNCHRLAVPTSKNGSRCLPHEKEREALRNREPRRTIYRDPQYQQMMLFGPCRMCGSWIDLTKDHVTPLAKGGTNDPSNIQVLCRSCNSSKGDTTT